MDVPWVVVPFLGERMPSSWAIVGAVLPPSGPFPRADIMTSLCDREGCTVEPTVRRKTPKGRILGMNVVVFFCYFSARLLA